MIPERRSLIGALPRMKHNDGTILLHMNR